MGIVFTLFIAALGLAAPIAGEYLPEASNPAQTCRLSFWQNAEGKGEHYVCSATVVGKSSVMTGAHCLEEQIKAVKTTIDCPGGVTAVIERGLGHPDNEFGANDGTSSSLQVDIAVLHAKTPLGVSPMRIVKDRDEEKSLLADPSKCRIAGWGLDDDGKLSGLHSAQVQSVETDYLDFTNLEVQHNKARITGKNLSQPGDSGGSLICKKGDEDVLVGVTDSGIEKKNSTAALLSRFKGWLDYALGEPMPVNDDLFRLREKNAEYCQKIDECVHAPQAKLSSDVVKALQKLDQKYDATQRKEADAQNDAKKLQKLNETLLGILVKCRGLDDLH